MTQLKDETKRRLTYILVTIAGILNVLNGFQERNMAILVAGGVLVLVAIGLLVATWE
jgi:hypothetical protein